MANSKGKTPHYPPYHFRSAAPRTLYFIEGHNIYDTHGKRTSLDDYAGLVSFLHSYHSLVFVVSLTSKSVYPFLSDNLKDNSTAVSCTKKGIPTCVNFPGARNSTSKIVLSSNWQSKREECTPQFLKDMQELYDYCGVGVHSSPGALGNALQLQVYTENKLRWHTAPNMMCQRFLWEHHIGGRCDTPGLHNEYPVAVELDMATGYGAHFQVHPTGTSCHFIQDAAWRYETFFAECEVYVPYELPLGPFPLRKENNAKKIVYPTEQGTYRAYLWREQIEDCLKLKLKVRIIHGYGWKELTNDNAAWARFTYALRQSAPTKAIEKNMKSIIVAGIGRHGMHNTYYKLIREPVSRADRLVVDSSTHEALYGFVHEVHEYEKAAMSHWYGYTIMQTSRSLFHYSFPYAVDGSLIMTNYDALMLDREVPPLGIEEKGTLAALMCEMGDLRYQVLTNVKILAPRHVKCDQKETLPGIAYERRSVA